MSAGKYDILIEQGASFSLIVNIDSVGIDLADYNARAQLRKDANDSNILSTFTIAITSATTNNTASFFNINANAKNTFYLRFINTSHDATTGTADLAFLGCPGGVAATEIARLMSSGNFGLGVAAPTAVLHLKAGTATAGTSPLKMTSGTLMTNPEVGAHEFLTDDYFLTITTGLARKNIVLWDTLGTLTRMPYTTTNGRLLTTTSSNDITLPVAAGKTVVLENPVYDDLWASIYLERSGGVSLVNSAFGNISEYTMNVNGFMDLPSIEAKHDYKEGTDMSVHLHIATNGLDASNRYTNWRIEYVWANPNTGVMGATTSFDSADLLIPANTADKTHLLLVLGTLTGTAKVIGSQLKIKMTRIASSGTAPSNAPYILQIGVHYQIDTMGSRTVSAK